MEAREIPSLSKSSWSKNIVQLLKFSVNWNFYIYLDSANKSLLLLNVKSRGRWKSIRNAIFLPTFVRFLLRAMQEISFYCDVDAFGKAGETRAFSERARCAAATARAARRLIAATRRKCN